MNSDDIIIMFGYTFLSLSVSSLVKSHYAFLSLKLPIFTVETQFVVS